MAEPGARESREVILISDRLYDGLAAEREIDDYMIDAGLGHYHSVHVDPYDDSIEFNRCPPEMRLSDEVFAWLRSQGFARCWLNHVDGMETYYAHNLVVCSRQNQATHRLGPNRFVRAWRELIS